MVDFVPICNVVTLKTLDEMGLLQRTILVNCKEVLEFAPAFEWIKKRNPIFQEVILISDGRNVNELNEAADIVEATHLVMPDFVNDGVSTLTLFKRGQNLRNRGISTIGVVNGTTSIEAMMCAIALREMGCDAFALPSTLTNNPEIGSRRHLVQRITEYMEEEIGGIFPIYLFGISNNGLDDLKSAMYSSVKALIGTIPEHNGIISVELADRIRTLYRYLNGSEND